MTITGIRTLAGAALALALVPPVTARAQQPADATTRAPVPLYDDLGDHHYEITTNVPKAQRYFDQGLRLYYAFNHQEAIRAFREAQRLDPECAMCWWGEALAWGPNINLPMDSAAGVAAYAALREALARADGAGLREQAFIEALAVRYAEDAPAERATLDSAYARSMRDVKDAYPDDIEAAVLYAESEMDLRPWDYWTPEATPYPGMDDALATLKSAMDRDPEHPGACHFYIHAVEKVYPDRAVDCAERLADLMPGAGHLVHMPGHIYIRVGRYMDAVRMNEHAVHADETYIQDQQPSMGVYTAGYYPHNYDFMAFAALMSGRRAQAVMASRKMTDVVPHEMMQIGDMVFGQHYAVRWLQIFVRFGLWDEILAAPAPPETLPHARALWQYARGRAFVATGDLAGAEAALAGLRQAAEGPELEGLRLEFNGAQHVLRIAEHVLAGRLAEARGDDDGAVAELRQAARLEDALYYGEPPEWTVPVRQELGAVLLASGRPDEARAAFEADLERFPANGWSLKGLELSLRALGRDVEADEAAARFGDAWRYADVDMSDTPAFAGRRTARRSPTTYVVTANQQGASVSVIDARGGAIVHTLPTEVGPHEATISSDGRWVIVSNYGDQQVRGGSLLAIDGRTLRIADTISLGEHRRPHGMAFMPGDSLLAVTVEQDSAVLLVRIPSGQIAAALPTGQRVSHMLAVHPSGRRIFTANITDATVSEIDVETGKLLRTVAVRPMAEAVGITPDGGELWVGSNTEHTITVLDTDDLSTIATVDAPGFPYRIAFTPDGTTAVVPQPEANVVRLFDVATHQSIGAIPVTGEPVGITISADGERAYVARNSANSVAVLSLTDLSVVRTLPAGAAPDGIVALEGHPRID